MPNYINGWKWPVFKIFEQPPINTLIDTINLPIVNASGLIENVQVLNITHEFNSRTLVQRILGYRITWTLPFDEYAKAQTMQDIQQIIRYCKAGYKIVLTPRADLPTRNFEVLYTGESFDMGIKKGGAGSVGNRLVVIEFTTKYLLDDIGWVDPNDKQYTGFKSHNPLNVIEI